MGEERIRVIESRCTLCRKCVDVCPYSCITIQEESVRIDEACCQFCRACQAVCEPEAIEIVTVELEQVEKDAYKGVMVFAEQRMGKIAPITFELLGKGRELADKLGEPLSCVLLGNGMKENASELVDFGADIVYLYDSPSLETFREDSYTELISSLAKEEKPSVMLFGGTSFGKSLASRTAARLDTGLTADCTGLDIDENGNLVQTRPAVGGNVIATILCENHRPQMATVRYKVMERAVRRSGREGKVIEKKMPEKLLDRTRVIDTVLEEEEDQDIEDAEVIVAGGMGLGKPEGFKLIRELAEALGAAFGASRAVVDEGWAPRTHQVGLSGKTVRPRIYIAIGISGAVQHLAGMRNSETIIAINEDPKAPIFDIATYGIVGDLYEIVPELIHQIKELSTRTNFNSLSH